MAGGFFPLLGAVHSGGQQVTVGILELARQLSEARNISPESSGSCRRERTKRGQQEVHQGE